MRAPGLGGRGPIYDATTSADDAAGVHKPDPGSPTNQAVRMLAECEALITGIPARSVHDLGLKAYAITWNNAEWWTSPGDGDSEPLARNLVDDILALAGFDRIRKAGETFQDAMPGYAGPPRFVENAQPAPSRPGPVSPAREPTSELQRLSADLIRTLRAHNNLDGTINRESPVGDWPIDRRDMLWDRVQAIQVQASHLEAQSLQDALFQVVVAYDVVSELYHLVELCAGPPVPDAIVEAALDRIVDHAVAVMREVFATVAMTDPAVIRRTQEIMGEAFLERFDELAAQADGAARGEVGGLC